ncbi:MAG: glutamate 5-kinase [Thermodesulfovibrionales bacterium]|nr:glutamate 5-kinase [Thermodesulfovibrionales bacterium]
MRIVLKIGSNIITQALRLDEERISSIAEEVSGLWKEGHEVIIVSSGAIAAGMGKLGLSEKPREIEKKQAVAAVGQSALIWAYEKAFLKHSLKVAQILLTAEDFSDRKRYINSRNTILTLLGLRITPVINENDTVATEEIKFGDNDNLSALVAGLVGARRLFILSDVNGLYNKDPAIHKDALLIKRLNSKDLHRKEILQMAGGSSTKVGTGGMYSKLLAAQKASGYGIIVHIINGKKEGLIKKILNGEELGTTILPGEERLTSRKGWIAFGTRAKGSLTIDDGAVIAIKEQGKSLLPSGIINVHGNFQTGDAVYCVDRSGVRIAKGLTNYSSSEIKKIRGRKSQEIEEILGYKYSDEVIHRDNLIVLS